MARVTDAEVKKILDTSIDTTPFIATATLLVDEELATSGMSEARLAQVELYLAAHFACAKDPRVTQEKVGDGSNTYQVTKGGIGLNATAYGEQATMLDTSGRLADLVKPQAKIETLSTVVSSWQ
jgi:hypothetical protein